MIQIPKSHQKGPRDTADAEAARFRVQSDRDEQSGAGEVDQGVRYQRGEAVGVLGERMVGCNGEADGVQNGPWACMRALHRSTSHPANGL